MSNQAYTQGGRTANPGGSASSATLANFLLDQIDSDQSWQDFQQGVLRPFEVIAKAPSTGDVKYRSFPIESRPTLSDYDLSSIYYGKSSSIELLALILHTNFLHRDSPDLLSVKSDFEGSHYFARYLSILKPQTTDEVGKSGQAATLVRFWDKFYNYFVPTVPTTPVRSVSQDDSRFYDWGLESGKSWASKYTPLQHHKWRVPGSRLNDLDTLLDENTIYKLSWLQDYLARMRTYRDQISGLASAIKERDDLTRRYEKMRDQFVSKNSIITDNLKRSLARRETRDPATNRQIELQRRFLRNVLSIYEQYLRGVREDERRTRLLMERRRRLGTAAASSVNQQRRFVAR